MIIFFSKPGNKDTIEKVTDEISQETHFCTSRKQIRELTESENADGVMLVRWGTTKPSGIYPSLTINHKSAISFASNKAKCRKYFDEKGLPVPRVFDNVYGSMGITYPCVGRIARHSCGRGFWYCENRGDYLRAIDEGAQYFSPFYDKTEEYRIHIAGGKVLFVQKKVGGDTSQPIWNHENGFEFEVQRRRNWNEDMNLEALRAMSLIDLDFGAVDVMASPDEEKPFVICEINTAPACYAYGAVKYAQYFAEEAQENGIE